MNITDQEYNELLAREEVALVDLWASWCGPCLKMNPVLERLEEKFEGKAGVYKVNIEQYPEIAQELGVRSIPALFVIKNGMVVEKFIGTQPEDKLSGAIEKALLD